MSASDSEEIASGLVTGSPSESESEGNLTPEGSESDENEVSPLPALPNTIGGFVIPDPNFDPKNNSHILEHYKRKQEKGILPTENELEEPVEVEIENAIPDWEAAKGRKATADERGGFASHLRKIRGGDWLEGLKVKLVGEKSVPIEHFNRLVAEYEATILFVSKQLADVKTTREAQVEELKKRTKMTSLGKVALTAARNQNAPLQKENLEMKQEISDLEQQLYDEKAETNTPDNNVLDNCQEQVVALEADLKTCRETGSQRDEELQQLQQQLQQLRNGEQGLKSDVRRSDDEIKSLKTRIKALTDKKPEHQRETQKLREQAEQDLRKCREHSDKVELNNEELKKDAERLIHHIKELEAKLKRCRDEAEANSLNADEALKKRNEDLRKRIVELEADLKKCHDKAGPARLRADKEHEEGPDRLRKEIEELREVLARCREGASPDQSDVEKLTKKLDKLKARDKLLQDLLDDYRNKWTRRVSDTNEDLRQFWRVVEDTQKAIGELQRRVLVLFASLGFGEKLDAMSAVNKLIDEVEKMPANTHLLLLHNLKLIGECTTAKFKLANRELLVSQLRERPPTTTTAGAGAGYDDEELEKRVEAHTQSYRQHRRDYLSNIFGAGNALQDIANGLSDAAIAQRLHDVRTKYLVPSSLPMPKVVPGRS